MDALKLPFNLKIIPVSPEGIPMGVPFLAMFNPESVAIKEDVEYNPHCTPGESGSDPAFVRVKARTFTLELTIDGTGVNTNGVKIPVPLQIALFRASTTEMKGIIHRPAYLLVQYGTFVVRCILKTSTVTYTMFDKFGIPIRAKISASFTEVVDKVFSKIVGMLSSPDLTHVREVKEGDILPLLVHQIYQNQTYYLQVARVNRLKNFRRLTAGTTLFFPPLTDQ